MSNEQSPQNPPPGPECSGELLQSVVDASPLAIIVSDTSGTVELWNPAAERIFGYSAQEVIGGPNPVVPVEGRNEYRSLRGAALRGEELSSKEVWRKRKDGSAIFISLSLSALRDDAGQPTKVIGVIADLTEKQQALEERARLEEQLRQSQKMEAIGRLAGGLAHDMNNVLQTVLAISELMQRLVEPDSPHQQHLRDLLTVCARGRDLTRDLLSFARKEPVQQKRIDLNELIEEVRSLIRRMVPRTIALQTDFAPKLDSVEGDPGQFSHALMNLCINAADAIEGPGLVTIRTSNATLDESRLAALGAAHLSPGRYARLDVQDNGAGIDEVTLSKVFEPFFTTKPEGVGTGLGLSIVQGTVSSHGGFVSVQSQLGQGTTVSIFLPHTATARPARETSELPVVAPVEGDARVLLVDDEEIILRSWKRLLGSLGYDVLTARNGHVALDLLEAEGGRVDLVVLDMIMPVMDGFETFHHLRLLYPELPVLIASGHLQEDQAQSLIDAGAVGFLPKPFDIDRMAQILNTLAPADD
jgi:two-component system cell cycle sensor histidine kinase/response regulator CckA